MSRIQLCLIGLWVIPVAGVAMASPAAAECYKTNSASSHYKGISGTKCIEPLEPSDGHYEESLCKSGAGPSRNIAQNNVWLSGFAKNLGGSGEAFYIEMTKPFSSVQLL